MHQVQNELRLGSPPKPKAQNLKHGRLADSVFESHPVGYDSRQYLGTLSVFMELKQSSRLPPALQGNDLEFRTPSLVALLRPAFTPSGHRGNLLFKVEEVKFLRDMVRVRGAYQYIAERMGDGGDESAFQTMATARHKKELGAALFTKRAS